LPLWLTEELAIELDLEAAYEETCRVLRIGWRGWGACVRRSRLNPGPEPCRHRSAGTWLRMEEEEVPSRPPGGGLPLLGAW